MYDLFEQKYKECEKSLFLVAIGFLHNTEDAKDCVQEAVFAAWKSFAKLQNPAFFKTWMTRIVINKCKDYLKQKRYTETLTDARQIFYELPTEDLFIMDCICKLPAKLAVYITLRFYHDMTYAQVASVLKQPISTVKYKTQKALLLLKTNLEGDGFHDHK